MLITLSYLLIGIGLGAWVVLRLRPARPSPYKVVITPRHAECKVGESVQFNVVMYDGAGDIVPLIGVTWSVSDPTVASVDDHGLVTVHAIRGKASVQAHCLVDAS